MDKSKPIQEVIETRRQRRETLRAKIESNNSLEVKFDEEVENDELGRQVNQRFELGSNIVPEFQELVSHGEYLNKIVDEKLLALANEKVKQVIRPHSPSRPTS